LWDEVLPESSVTLPRWGLMRDGALWQPLTLARPTEGKDAGLWPTPNAMKSTNDLNFQCSGDGRMKPNKLGWAVAQKIWPTPTVNDSKNCTLPPSQVNHDNLPGALLRNGEKTGGGLNPMWVEWLMGWPLGWTDLNALETGRFRQRRRPLLENSLSYDLCQASA